MTNRILPLILMLLYLASATLFAQDGHEDCDHEHEADHKATTAVLETHDHEAETHGYDHDAHDHDDHDIVVNLSPEAQKMAGLELAKATSGDIVKTSELPGEVGFNEDRLIHITPRFEGIALEARYRVGSYVNAGDIVAVIESNESMNPYSIEAPISGWIISRHISKGEYVSQENSIYVLADLSTVWVNLAAYPKDADLVRTGQEVLITAIGSKQQVTGIIEFVTPMLDILTRSNTARVVLPNPDNLWQPGTFVHAQVATKTGESGLIVEKEAVQLIGEESVIFVVEGPDEFVAREVIVGDSDDHHARILEGLTEGVEYVSVGAFELKAQVITSSFTGHEGHGH